jgi:hypothetical protein
VTSLLSRSHQLPRLLDGPRCATSGCLGQAAEEGHCGACLARQVRYYRKDAARWKARYGALVRLARTLVDVLGVQADPPPDGVWLEALRDAHGQVEAAVYPQRSQASDA